MVFYEYILAKSITLKSRSRFPFLHCNLKRFYITNILIGVRPSKKRGDWKVFFCAKMTKHVSRDYQCVFVFNMLYSPILVGAFVRFSNSVMLRPGFSKRMTLLPAKLLYRGEVRFLRTVWLKCSFSCFTNKLV